MWLGWGGRSRWSEGGDCLEKEAGKERRGIEGFVRKKSERGEGREAGLKWEWGDRKT